MEALIKVAASLVAAATTTSEMEAVISEVVVVTEGDLDKEVAAEALTKAKTPEPVVVLGEFLHPCEDDIVCKCTTGEDKVPYFNDTVYLEKKEQISKVGEIFGQLRDVCFSIKLSANMKASSFQQLQKLYIDS